MLRNQHIWGEGIKAEGIQGENKGLARSPISLPVPQKQKKDTQNHCCCSKNRMFVLKTGKPMQSRGKSGEGICLHLVASCY